MSVELLRNRFHERLSELVSGIAAQITKTRFEKFEDMTRMQGQIDGIGMAVDAFDEAMRNLHAN